MREWAGTITTIVGAIIGLAILSVIVSKRSQAPDVIQASASALSSVISAAVNPITTAATNGNPALSTFSSPSNSSIPVAGFLSNLWDTGRGSSQGGGQSWESIAAGLTSSSNFKIME